MEPVHEVNNTINANAKDANLNSKQPKHGSLPEHYPEIKKQIYEQSQKFLDDHLLRLKIRRLPLHHEVLNKATVAKESDAKYLPLYHFVTRQKEHMTEQLLRNRSSYKTEFNTPYDERNKQSPYVLRDMPNFVTEHLKKMSLDFEDPEFSGVWLSLHTQPFMTDNEFGGLARSKIVGWALIEVLTTNERCLKALWVHPTLGAQATTDLLKGFLPRVILEAFELVAPQDEDSCPWKFFYTWLNDFDMLPRQTWLILTNSKYFGLPKHCDNLGESEDSALGHVDDGNPLGSDCPCQKIATWNDWDQVLVGCTEAYMYQFSKKWLDMIPSKPCARLLDDTQALPNEEPEKHTKMEQESKEELVSAELLGLSQKEVAASLQAVYGKWCHHRIKGLGEYLGNPPQEERRHAMNSDGPHPSKRHKS